jgi:hypothetical protein
MTSVRYSVPKYNLAKQLRTPGGVPVVEALEAAATNLAQLRGDGIAELAAVVRRAQDCFEAFPLDVDADRIASLYAIAAGGIGIGAVCGAPAADAALISLCDLLDNMRVTKRFDPEAVAVHLQSLHLLAGPQGQDLGEAASAAILGGLRKVTTRYAER